jgi:predicted secreted protein
MATQGTIGHGSKFSMGDGGSPEVFVDVAEVFAITPPNFTRDAVDVTHMQSPEKWREWVPGLRDAGEVEIQVNFIPGNATQDQLWEAFNDDVPSNFRITFPNNEVWNFAAMCTGFAAEDPLDAKMTATVTFKVSGKPAFLST